MDGGKVLCTANRLFVVFVKNEPLTVKDDLERTIAELNAKFLNIREEGLIRRFDSKKLIQVFSFYSSLLYFSDDILSGINEL
jgi:hypothetical protein